MQLKVVLNDYFFYKSKVNIFNINISRKKNKLKKNSVSYFFACDILIHLEISFLSVVVLYQLHSSVQLQELDQILQSMQLTS